MTLVMNILIAGSIEVPEVSSLFRLTIVPLGKARDATYAVAARNPLLSRHGEVSVQFRQVRSASCISERDRYQN